MGLAARLLSGFALNAAYSLICLCQHHYGIADRTKVAPDRRQSETLRKRLLGRLTSKERL